MYDKTTRRRRAVLIALVALSLVLLTAYFGEAPSGRLHSVQRDFLTIVSPIQDGANKVLKPVRDLFGWFGDTLHAKSQNSELRKQNVALTKQLIQNQADERSLHNLLKFFNLDNELKISDYHPVSATVVIESPNLWYATVNINKGESSGVHVNDPVINQYGVVGKVTQVASDGAHVSLITDSEVGIIGRINSTGVTGMVQPKVGEPNDLLLQYLPSTTHVKIGDYVVTAGTLPGGGQYPSLYPPGIPIGRVTSVDAQSPYKSVNLHPLVDLHNLEVVQVLTDVPGSLPAQISNLAASLPPAGSPPTQTPTGEKLASNETGG
ncbi:MAG TPA: rod shape-determining protein MreC [Solirubrobacteraceae bacterium]